jgi:hypothetical protein
MPDAVGALIISAEAAAEVAGSLAASTGLAITGAQITAVVGYSALTAASLAAPVGLACVLRAVVKDSPE